MRARAIRNLHTRRYGSTPRPSGSVASQARFGFEAVEVPAALLAIDPFWIPF